MSISFLRQIMVWTLYLILFCLKNDGCNTFQTKVKEPRVQTRLPVAEKEGFEPSLRYSHTTPLAGEPLEPLGYFSVPQYFSQALCYHKKHCLSKYFSGFWKFYNFYLLKSFYFYCFYDTIWSLTICKGTIILLLKFNMLLCRLS